jgi:hypothetical protein
VGDPQPALPRNNSNLVAVDQKITEMNSYSTSNTRADWNAAFDYLQDALDIEYIVNSKREYLGARVLVAFGGPNIWINTRTKKVEGYWWNESASASFDDGIDLDSALEELWNC